MNSHDMAIDRALEHCFGAPVPQTFTPVRNALFMPFTNVVTDAGSGTDDPHPTRVAGVGPLALMDDDVACATTEIRFVDP